MWSQRNGQLRPKTSWVAGFYFIALPCSLLLPVPNADGPDVFVWARGSGEGGGGVYSLQGQQDTDFHLRPQYSQLLCFVLLCFVSFSISHCMLVMGPLSDAGLQKQLPKAMLVLLGVLLGKVGKTGSLRSGPGTGSPPKVQPFPPSCT